MLEVKGIWKRKMGEKQKNAEDRFTRHKSDLVGRDAVHDVMCFRNVMEGHLGDVIRDGGTS